MQLFPNCSLQVRLRQHWRYESGSVSNNHVHSIFCFPEFRICACRTSLLIIDWWPPVIASVKTGVNVNVKLYRQLFMRHLWEHYISWSPIRMHPRYRIGIQWASGRRLVAWKRPVYTILQLLITRVESLSNYKLATMWAENNGWNARSSDIKIQYGRMQAFKASLAIGCGMIWPVFQITLDREVYRLFSILHSQCCNMPAVVWSLG